MFNSSATDPTVRLLDSVKQDVRFTDKHLGRSCCLKKECYPRGCCRSVYASGTIVASRFHQFLGRQQRARRSAILQLPATRRRTDPPGFSTSALPWAASDASDVLHLPSMPKRGSRGTRQHLIRPAGVLLQHARRGPRTRSMSAEPFASPAAARTGSRPLNCAFSFSLIAGSTLSCARSRSHGVAGAK